MPLPDNKEAENGNGRLIVRHVTADISSSSTQGSPGAPPVKEFAANGPNSASRKAEGQTGCPDMPGRHVVFVIVRQHSNDYPIVSVLDHDGNSREAVMLFTRREAAILYLQVARSSEYTVVALSPQEAAGLLHMVRSHSIEWMVIDPNRRHQEDSQPAGPVVSLKTLNYDPSGENLYQEIFDFAANRQTS